MTAVIPARIKKKKSEFVHFCVAILISKMEEKKQHFWHTILCYFMKGKNGTEMQKLICSECGGGAVTDGTSKAVCEAHGGGFSLDNAPHRVDQLKLIGIQSRY